MQAQITRTQLTVSSGFSRAMLDLQTQLRDQIQATLERREREIAESLASAEQLLAAESSDRRAAQTKAEDRLRAVVDLTREAGALLAEMRRARPTDASVLADAPSVEQR